MSKIKKICKNAPSFDEVKKYYEDYLHPSKINFEDHHVYEYVFHAGRWAGIFQATQKATQKFFQKCKPENVTDLAAITSIWRPGPLSGKMHELYVDAKFNKPYDWGDDLINETLKDTYNLLIFQEQIMLLANKVAGYDMTQCDQIRRAILKRSLATGEAQKKEAQELRETFEAGCVKNGVAPEIAKKLYDNVLSWGSYGFNKAHAVGYAMISYQCAHLMTYHEESWLTAYLESMSNNPDDRAKAFSEIRALGYKIVPIDINHAGSGWTVLPGKQFMPSFTTVKGVGDAAVVEILQERPYKSIEDVLWDENGFWKHSKFNKRALEALVNIGAFNSLDCIGEDKLFSSTAHMYEVIITHIDDIKKRTSKEPQKGRETFYRLVKELRDKVEPWSRREVALKQIERLGSLDVSALVEPQLLDVFNNKGVPSIDEYEEKGVYWFVAGRSTPKTTKNKKQYTLLECMGQSGKMYRCFVWGVKQSDPQIEPYSVCFGEVSKSDFGFATQRWNLRILE
jgi:DNA polymerase III alpha subunit